MESYLSEEQSDITFTTDENKNEDHVDRALRNLKDLQRENDFIRKEMQRIKANPKAFIKPIRDELSLKINQLREENDSLRRMVEKSKIPAYCEMTKKKIIATEYDEQ
jgi:phage host-nuclease inhibitor protein Gam